MRVLDVVGQLVPPREKNLMPLSGSGLCDAEIITPKSAPMRVDEVRGRGGREHAGVEHVDAGGREPRDHGGLEELAAGARVASDDRDRSMRRRSRSGVRARRGRGGQPGRGQRRQR